MKSFYNITLPENSILLTTNTKTKKYFDHFHLILSHSRVYVCLSLFGNIVMVFLKLTFDHDIPGGISYQYVYYQESVNIDTKSFIQYIDTYMNWSTIDPH